MSDTIFYSDDELNTVIESLQIKNKKLENEISEIKVKVRVLIEDVDTASRILKGEGFHYKAAALKNRCMELAEMFGIKI